MTDPTFCVSKAVLFEDPTEIGQTAEALASVGATFDAVNGIARFPLAGLADVIVDTTAPLSGDGLYMNLLYENGATFGFSRQRNGAYLDFDGFLADRTS